MAHYNQQDADEYIPCPYNKNEMITVRRMPQHLIRCPHRNETEFETCPYNAIHIIPRADYRQHLTTCPARVVAEKSLNYELEKQNDNLSGRVKLKGCTVNPEYNTYDIQCSENWDDDEVNDVKPYSYLTVNVPDNVSEKSEMDSGIDVHDLSEVEFNDPEDRRSTKTHQDRDRRQNTPIRKPKQAPSVFQYSLRMAGVKEGHSLPGQAAPSILQDSGMDMSLASEIFQDEIYDSKPLDPRPKVKLETQDIRLKVKHETLDVRPKVKHEAQDVRLKVKHETKDVRPKMKHETQDVRSKMKHETQDVRSKMKHETQDVRLKVRQGLDKEASDHLRSNSRAISKMNQNFEIEASPDLRPKVRQYQSCDYNSDLNLPARDTSQKEIYVGQNLRSPEVESKMPVSQLSPGAGRGAILKFLISNNSPSISSASPDSKHKTLLPNSPLSPALKGIGRGALAQYILGKTSTESSLHATPSLNTEGTSNVSQQGFGRGMLVQILSKKKVLANSASEVAPLEDTPQVLGMLVQDKNEIKAPENSETKVIPQDLGREMLVQDGKEKIVPAKSQPKFTPPDNTPQVPGQGMLAQILNESKRGLENPKPKVSRIKESDDEEDWIPEFEGIGRGARLKNGNQDPRLYPPSLGSNWSNKNFEYAKN